MQLWCAVAWFKRSTNISTLHAERRVACALSSKFHVCEIVLLFFRPSSGWETFWALERTCKAIRKSTSPHTCTAWCTMYLECSRSMEICVNFQAKVCTQFRQLRACRYSTTQSLCDSVIVLGVHTNTIILWMWALLCPGTMHACDYEL